MKRNLYVGCVLFALVFLLTISSAAQAALANRVFVSQRSGNDANACDNINTPCQTFAGAVLQLNAGGEAIVLDSGGYGPVTITQSLTIEAPPGVLAFIHPPSGDAITVNAGASDKVVLRGLVLNGGSGKGITVNTVGVFHVESCVISGFATYGIYFLSAGQLFVKDTVIRENTLVGLSIVPSSGTVQASVDHCRLESNNFGISVLTNAKATIRESVVSGNGTAGLDVEGGELNAEECLVANNFNGLQVLGGMFRVSNCTVTDNHSGLFVGSGSMLSRSNNTVQGNTIHGSFTGTYSAE